MKKKMILLFFAASLYGQSLPADVTGLQVVNILNDGVVLEWYSSRSNALPEDFVFYYNPTNAVADASILNQSQIVRVRNFRTSPRGGRFLYSAEIPLRVSGEFYFAVIPNGGLFLDESIGQDRFLPSSLSFFPEQNYTVQPVAFRLRGSARITEAVQSMGTATPVLIKSLRLSSEEDSFRLTWAVSQNNRSGYAFRIYRSRYPITGLLSNQLSVRALDSLPVYAEVKDRFFFEDRNISFEVPYYYAVVAEGSVQWDSGINVFSTPAVLVRQSPPFSMTPQQETIKQSRPFTINQNSDMTETDIQRAVEQTLSNLIYAPSFSPLNGDNEATNIPNTAPLTPEDIRENPLQPLPAPTTDTLYRGSLGPVSDDHLYRAAAQQYQKLLAAEKQLEENFVKEEERDKTLFLRGIDDLNMDILAYFRMSSRLAYSSLGEVEYKALKSEFLKKRDQILLKEFSLKRNRQNFQAKAQGRRENLSREIMRIQDNYREVQEGYRRSLNVQGRVEALTRKVSQPQESPQFLSQPSVKLSEPVYVDEAVLAVLPQPIPPEVRLQNMQPITYNEKIPSLEELERRSRKREQWMKDKVQWLQGNQKLWQENAAAWREAIPEIFENSVEYQRLRSAWEVPSFSVPSQTAYSKGKEAFDQERYDEAAFFLVRIPENDNALLMLGQSFSQLGRHKEAVSVFATAHQMNIPGAAIFLREAAQKDREEAVQQYEEDAYEDSSYEPFSLEGF